MKGIGVLISLALWAAPLCAAQSLTAVLAETPPCALPCLTSEIPAANCSLTDFENLPSCACTNTTLLASLTICVQDACPFEQQAQATILLGGICSEFPKESRVIEVKTTGIACLALTLLFVLLRCISRFLVSSRLWWDDWTTLLATASLIALTSVYIVAADLGFGLHYWDLNPYNAQTILQLFYSSQMLYIVIQVTAKAAILTVFWRIFNAKWLRRSIWGCVAFLVGHGLIFLFLVAFQCSPVPAVWDKTIEGKCINVTAVAWVGAIFSILEDIVILALPVPEVLKLQLSPKKKVAVCLMFSIGSFACVTSMVRLKYMVTFANSLDATWDNVDIIIWSIIEVTCAIICGSLPTLRPLLQKVPHLLTSVKASEYGRGTSNTASGAKDQNSRARSHVFAPGAFRKLGRAPWETETDDDAKGTHQVTTNIQSVKARRMTSESEIRESQEDYEMQILAREKSTV